VLFEAVFLAAVRRRLAGTFRGGFALPAVTSLGCWASQLRTVGSLTSNLPTAAVTSCFAAQATTARFCLSL
jgi:hypothetical protein